VAGGCGDSSKREAYRRVARDANPLLTTLRPAAAQLLALRPDDHAAIVAACTGSDDALRRLRDVRFDDPAIWTDPRVPLVSDPAEWLLDHRSLMCKPDNGDPTRLVRCSEWCRETWTHMIDAVARLRDAAKAEGVDIVLLWP
jgi:hypothetical protein